MSLNAKQIETFSIDALRDSLSLTDFLDPYIADNDKEPSWDGNIYIYKSKEHKKDNLKGRIPVQIKGKECNELSFDTITYSMDTSDLNNYLYDGGAILFVIYISNGGLSKKIYYIELPPIKLRHILKSAKKQKKKSLTLKEFPIDNNKKVNIFLNCLRHCQMQSSFTDTQLLSLEDIEKQGLVENFSVPILGVGINYNLQQALITNEVYLYAKIKGSSILHPIDILPQYLTIREERDTIISIGEKIYYNKVSLIKSQGKMTFQFGSSFSIIYTSENKPGNIEYKRSNYVRILAQDLDFLLGYIQEGYFNMNGVKIPFDKEHSDLSNFNYNQEAKNLLYIKKIVSLLDLLNCNKDLNLSNLSKEDFKKIDKLITAFIDKKPVCNLPLNLPPITKLIISNLCFVLYFKPVKTSKTSYEILDFFKTQICVEYNGQKGEKLSISQFSILHTEDLINVDNIRFDILEPSFEKVKKHYDTFNRDNWFMLDLLNAFDKTHGKRTDIMNAAKQFDDWIMTSNEDDLPYVIKKLNHLQIVKRERELTFNEITELYDIVEGNTTSEDVIVGAYLLLEQQTAAERHFSKLTPEQQNNFRAYPIYHFWLNNSKY